MPKAVDPHKRNATLGGDLLQIIIDHAGVHRKDPAHPLCLIWLVGLQLFENIVRAGKCPTGTFIFHLAFFHVLALLIWDQGTLNPDFLTFKVDALPLEPHNLRTAQSQPDSHDNGKLRNIPLGCCDKLHDLAGIQISVLLADTLGVFQALGAYVFILIEDGQDQPNRVFQGFCGAGGGIGIDCPLKVGFLDVSDLRLHEGREAILPDDLIAHDSGGGEHVAPVINIVGDGFIQREA